MHKGYICKDLEALVFDDDGNKKIIEYQDNIEEILIQENELEEIENQKEKIENKLDSECKNLKLKNKIIILTILIPILVFIICNFLPSILKIVSANIFLQKINLGVLLSIIFVPISAILSSLISNDYYKEYNKNLKVIQAYEIELTILEKLKQYKNDKIEKLKNNKENKNVSNNFYLKELDKSYIKNLKINFDFYFNLGYNEKKYYRLYKNGRLANKIEKKYGYENSLIAQSYFDDKENQKIKKIKYTK